MGGGGRDALPTLFSMSIHFAMLPKLQPPPVVILTGCAHRLPTQDLDVTAMRKSSLSLTSWTTDITVHCVCFVSNFVRICLSIPPGRQAPPCTPPSSLRARRGSSPSR